jgi:very-short-patch-repair endonuclease
MASPADIDRTPRGLARTLRKQSTDVERLLWRLLRGRRFAGWKFRRQHPVGPFVVDFACLESHVIIELDGGQHARQEQADLERTAFLRRQGFSLLRFWNRELLQNQEGVLQVIWDALNGDRKAQ